MQESVLELSGIRKTYRGGVEALKGVDLSVPHGCIYGLLGPNGAGKSTLVKILTTLIRPSGGAGTMLGRPIGDREILRKVGLLPEHVRFPDYLTGRQVIEFAGGLNGLAPKAHAKRIDELLEKVGMAADQNRKIKGYSKGMKQRIGIAQALVNDPEIIFLDEPTDGVDPAGRRDVRELMRGLREEGKTVFINTHLLPELEPVVDRVAILSRGQLLGEGPLEEVRGEEVTFTIEFEGPLTPDVLRGGGIVIEPGRVVVKAEKAVEVQPLIDQLRAKGVIISSIQRNQQSLEELFLGLVAESQPTPPPMG
ncbi:MAG: ABC transporter ATP-binding protein [Akkermansiaceae bacterium]